MKTIYHPADQRGSADFGWLKAKQSFSFGRWYDPEKVHFGALRVLNDDRIQGGQGFGTHPHDNMEIVTIPLQGALAHKDSTGGNGIINAGDVQIMSAGTGVTHSEFNASKTEEAQLLQVWIFPKLENIKPRYDQQNFGETRQQNSWQILVSPDENDGGMWINQDAVFSMADIDAGKTLSYKKKFADNGVYFFLIEGSVKINDQQVEKRDALGVWDTADILVTTGSEAKILAIEIPMLK